LRSQNKEKYSKSIAEIKEFPEFDLFMKDLNTDTDEVLLSLEEQIKAKFAEEKKDDPDGEKDISESDIKPPPQQKIKK